MKKQPDTAYLINACGLTHALVGFYDTPTIDGFSNVVEKRGCLFSSFQDWQHGKMTHISRLRPGCIGSAYWWTAVHDSRGFFRFFGYHRGLKTRC